MIFWMLWTKIDSFALCKIIDCAQLFEKQAETRSQTEFILTLFFFFAFNIRREFTVSYQLLIWYTEPPYNMVHILDTSFLFTHGCMHSIMQMLWREGDHRIGHTVFIDIQLRCQSRAQRELAGSRSPTASLFVSASGQVSLTLRRVNEVKLSRVLQFAPYLWPVDI